MKNVIIVNMLEKTEHNTLKELKIALNMDNVFFIVDGGINYVKEINGGNKELKLLRIYLNSTDYIVIVETFGGLLEKIANEKNPKTGWTLL